MPPDSIFKNSRYAGEATLRSLFASAATKPFVATFTPVMILILAMALLEMPVAWMLRYGTACAAIVATCWTFFQLSRTPAEIVFRDGTVSIRSALELWTQGKGKPRNWKYIIDIERRPASVMVTAGHTSYEFLREDWPQFQGLYEHFEASMLAFNRRATR